MDHMFTISNETDESEELGDSDQLEVCKTAEPLRSGERMTVPQKLKVEPRQRNHSMNEEDLQETGAGRHGEVPGDGELFRRRCRSAPPALWAAKKYGRQLRKMSDEFDSLMDKGMKRVRSAGAARQMHNSPSWLAFLWSHKESDSEACNSSRPAE